MGLDDRPRERLLTLVTLGRRHGVPEADLLRGTGLTLAGLSDPRVPVRTAQEYDMIRNLAAAVGSGAALPLEAGLDFHLRNVRAWGRAMVTSTTLGEALAFSLTYAEALETQIRVTASVADGRLTLVVDDDHLPADVRAFVALRNLVFIAMTARELLGRPVPLLSVTAAADKPPYAGRIDEFAGVPVQWRQERTSVGLDAGWLDRPLPGADEREHLRAVQQCRLELDRHRAPDGLAARVGELVAGGHLTLAEVAGALALSERSLRRRLQGEGTTFRRLLGSERLRRADELFAAGHTVERVARELGYSEASAFSNAFKRWSGMSPEAWRQGA